LWKTGAGRSGAGAIGRGAGFGGQNWRTFSRSRTVSAERAADAPVRSPRSEVQGHHLPSRGGGRGVFSEGARHCPPAAGEIPGTARRAEPEPSLAATGQERRGPSGAGGDVRVVYRRV